MSEDEWMGHVEDLLSESGMGMDSNNDGWNFMFENGWSPAQAVAEMGRS